MEYLTYRNKSEKRLQNFRKPLTCLKSNVPIDPMKENENLSCRKEHKIRTGWSVGKCFLNFWIFLVPKRIKNVSRFFTFNLLNKKFQNDLLY